MDFVSIILIFVLIAVCCALFVRNKTLNRKLDEASATAAKSEIENAKLLERLNMQIGLNDKAQQESHSAIDKAEAKIAEVSECLEVSSKEIIALKTENAQLQERLKNISDDSKTLREQAEMQFRSIADKIFDEKSETFRKNNETRISEILNPLKEDINRFKDSINQNRVSDAQDRSSIKELINIMMEQNKSIGKEAKELTTALRGNPKVQGDWGEMVLQNILDRSGLVKGREYDTQVSTNPDGSPIKNEDGNLLRPDVVIHIPGGKNIIIDSKVSLTDYTDYVNATDPKAQETAIGKHICSVRKHIDELYRKKYQNYVKDSADFVIMFIPNESAYIAAMQNDNDLWNDAFQKKITIMCPSNFISILQLIVRIWDQDKQTRNAIEIATKAGALYDKFIGFLSDMEKIHKGLELARKSYDDAWNKLKSGRGNVIRSIESLKELGAKASKSLPASFSDYDDGNDSPTAISATDNEE